MTDRPAMPLTEAANAMLAQQAMIGEATSRINTAAFVRVQAVGNGTVDVLPLVNQVDEAGKPVPHGTVHALPFLRVQGGINAVILDPAVGDLGLVVFASRDSSAAKSTRGQANPGSRRRHNMADGFYLGGFLNAVPAQFIRFSTNGIEIVSTGTIAIRSPSLTHNGRNIGVTHTHDGVQAGTAKTGAPTP